MAFFEEGHELESRVFHNEEVNLFLPMVLRVWLWAELDLVFCYRESIQEACAPSFRSIIYLDLLYLGVDKSLYRHP